MAKKEEIMKQILISLSIMAMLAACSHQNCEPKIYTLVKEKIIEKKVYKIIKVPKPVPIPVLAIPGHIRFETNKWDLNVEGEDILEIVGRYATLNPRVNVRLEGYCDHRGTEKYNLWLSRKRADEAALYLEAQGVDRKRMDIRAFGEAKRLNLLETEGGMAKNRRVEIYFTRTNESAG